MTQDCVFTLLSRVPVKPLQLEKGEYLRLIHHISTLRKQCPYMTTAIGNTHCDKPSCGSVLSQLQYCLYKQSHSTGVSGVKQAVNSNQPFSSNARYTITGVNFHQILHPVFPPSSYPVRANLLAESPRHTPVTQPKV